MHALLARLHACGHDRVTEAHLVLFGNLDCGTTYASAIAQRVRVSRQAISKTLRELQTLGFIRLENDPTRANQKLVVMTTEGMQLANDARRELADIEASLADRIGQENVDRIRGAIDRLTGILEFVGDVQERGVVAIWEYIQGQISGLWDMVLGKAQEWIMERVIGRAVQWLMSLLDPSGVMAVVNSVRSFIAAVQSAVEYARDILAIVADYVSTIAAVARGEVGPGAILRDRDIEGRGERGGEGVQKLLVIVDDLRPRRPGLCVFALLLLVGVCGLRRACLTFLPVFDARTVGIAVQRDVYVDILWATPRADAGVEPLLDEFVDTLE